MLIHHFRLAKKPAAILSLSAVISMVFGVGQAFAEIKQLTFRTQAITVAGYEVKQASNFGNAVPKPLEDGFVTAMEADVVDANGNPVPIQRLMLHHIVFANLGDRIGAKKDGTCNSFLSLDSKTKLPAFAQRFYAAGEERAKLELPNGYGYPVKANDLWGMTWMLMNHRQQTDTAFIQYKVTIDTDASVKPVTPYWLDAQNCQADPVFNVPGNKKQGSAFMTDTRWSPPENGRIVAGAGHLHGGGKSLQLLQPQCSNRSLLQSDPAWGLASHPFYHVKPVLHEPGPINMSSTLTAKGIPIQAQQPLTLRTTYDGERPHTRAMGIMLVFVSPQQADTEAPCEPLPDDIEIRKTTLPHRDQAPRVTIPLTGLNQAGKAVTIQKPPGRQVASLRRNVAIRVTDTGFQPSNLKIRIGTKVSWRFTGSQLHNVTLASGPFGFSSPNLDTGRRYSEKLTQPGSYKLFCALHPVRMTETVHVSR